MHATWKVKNVAGRVYRRLCRRMSRRALTRETMSASHVFFCFRLLLVGVLLFPCLFWSAGLDVEIYGMGVRVVGLLLIGILLRMI